MSDVGEIKSDSIIIGTLAPGRTMERTSALRFVERDWTDGNVGCRVTILQQAWVCRETGEVEWKDVEKVKE